MFGFQFRGDDRCRRVYQAEDCETLISEGKGAGEFQQSQDSRWTTSAISVSFFWPLSMLISVLVGVQIGIGLQGNLDRLCTKQISQYSPMMEDIDISYSVIQYSGSLMHENIFRQAGSPEVDSAWESLGIEFRHIVVPNALAEKSGLEPGQVQVSEKYGGGYPANVEGLHHLHCLNLVRKSLYYNFDYYHSQGDGEFADDDRTVRFHVSHCLDIIRQQLMCNVDIGVLGQVWWNKKAPVPFPDFNTNHKCRNYAAIRQWAEEHQAPEDLPEDYLKPPRSEQDVLASMP